MPIKQSQNSQPRRPSSTKLKPKCSVRKLNKSAVHNNHIKGNNRHTLESSHINDYLKKSQKQQLAAAQFIENKQNAEQLLQLDQESQDHVDKTTYHTNKKHKKIKKPVFFCSINNALLNKVHHTVSDLKHNMSINNNSFSSHLKMQKINQLKHFFSSLKYSLHRRSQRSFHTSRPVRSYTSLHQYNKRQYSNNINPFLQRHEELVKKKSASSSSSSSSSSSLSSSSSPPSPSSRQPTLSSSSSSPSSSSSSSSYSRSPSSKQPQQPPPSQQPPPPSHKPPPSQQPPSSSQKPPSQKPPSQKPSSSHPPPRPVCSQEVAQYMQSTIYKPLGTMFHINQNLPRHHNYSCQKITTFSTHDEATYTFLPKSPITNYPYMTLHYTEQLQPHLHNNILSLQFPQPNYYHLISIDELPTSYTYQRFYLLQNIIKQIIQTTFSLYNQEFGIINNQSNINITIPTNDIRNNPISITLQANNNAEYVLSTNNLFKTLYKLCYDEKMVENIFFKDIVRLEPYNDNNTLLNKNRSNPVNVHVETGEIIDLNEGVDDPELVNNIIKELNFDPHNLTQKQFDIVYKEVDARLQQNFSSKSIYSEDEEAELITSDDDDDGDIDDINDADEHDAIISAQDAIQKKTNKKLKKANVIKGDDGDILDPDDEVFPQDKRMYHGILSPEAVRAIELSEQQDKLADEAEAAEKEAETENNTNNNNTNTTTSNTTTSDNTQTHTTKHNDKKSSTNTNTNNPSFSKKWKFQGQFYNELLSTIHSQLKTPPSSSQQISQHNTYKLQLRILQSLSPQDVQEHFRLHFSSFFQNKQTFQHLFSSSSSSSSSSFPPSPIPSHITRHTEHILTPIQLHAAGPDVSLSNIIDILSHISPHELQPLCNVISPHHNTNQRFYYMSSSSTPPLLYQALTQGSASLSDSETKDNLITAQIETDDDKNIHTHTNTHVDVIPHITFPIIRVKKTPGPYISAQTSVQFHHNVPMNTSRQISHTNSIHDTTMMEYNDYTPLTSFASMSRCALHMFKPHLLSDAAPLYDLGADCVGNPIILEQRRVYDPIVELKSDVDKIEWLKTTFKRRYRLILPDFQNNDDVIEHKLRLLMIPSSSSYNSAFSHFDLQFGVVKQSDDNGVNNNNNTGHHDDTKVDKTTSPASIFHHFSQESPETQQKINTLLERVALRVILRSVEDKFNTAYSNTHKNHVKNTLTISTESSEMIDYFSPLLQINVMSNFPHITTSQNDGYDAATDSVKHLFTYLENTIGDDTEMFFSYKSIIDQLLIIQEELSLLLASSSSISSHVQKEEKNNLLLAKKYLPLLIFGNAPDSRFTPTLATWTVLHFESLLNRYILSNEQRRFVVSLEPSQFQPLQLNEDEDRELQSIIEVDTDIDSNSGDNEGDKAMNEENDDHKHKYTKDELLSKHKAFKKWEKDIFKSLEIPQKTTTIDNIPSFKNKQKLYPNDYLMNNERLFHTSNEDITSFRHRVKKPICATIHHSIGGQIYIPVPQRYNTNPERVSAYPNMNYKQDYNVKWISTKNVKNAGQNNQNSAQLAILQSLQRNGYVDRCISSHLVTPLHLNKLSNTLQFLSSSLASGNITSSKRVQAEIQRDILALLPLPAPETKPTSDIHAANSNTPDVPQPPVYFSNMHENNVNMAYTKCQQEACPPEQLLLPVSKHIARPVHVTIDDNANNFVFLDIVIDSVAQRLTPYQIMLLPILEHIFGQQKCDATNKYSSHHDVLDTLGMNVQMKFGYIVSDELNEENINAQNSGAATGTATGAAVSTLSKTPQLQCVISTRGHVNNIEQICHVLVHMLTTTDLTDNIVSHLTSFSEKMTQTHITSDEFAEDDVEIGLDQGETQNSRPKRVSNAGEMSLFHSISRVVSNPSLHEQNPWNTSSKQSSETISDSPFFFNATRGLQQHQHVSPLLQNIFRELQGTSYTSNDTNDEYIAKLKRLPQEWQDQLSSSSPSSSPSSSTSSSPSSHISPMLISLTNDLAETLKCLLLGPVENQFVHSPVISQPPSSPSPTDPSASTPHSNFCNNNYFSLPSSTFDPETILSSPSSCPTAFLPHPLLQQLQPSTSIPLPQHLSVSPHRFDPTYANIYNNSLLSKQYTCTAFGVSSFHLRTNKHTLLQPEYTTSITTGIAKIVNMSLVSRLSAFPPETSLLACYMHQRGEKHVFSNKLHSTPIVPSNHGHNVVDKGTANPDSMIGSPTPISDDDFIISPKLPKKTVIPSISALKPNDIHHTRVVPLTAVRNIYATSDISSDISKTLQSDNSLLRISTHGNVSYTAPELLIQADTVQEETCNALWYQYHEEMQHYQQFLTQQKSAQQSPQQRLPPPPQPPRLDTRLTMHVSAENWFSTQHLEQVTVRETIREKERSSEPSSEIMRIRMQQRPNHYIAVNVAQLTTSIAFPGIPYAMVGNNKINAMRFGLIMLSKICLEYLFTHGSVNTYVQQQRAEITPNSKKAISTELPVNSFLLDCLSKQHSSQLEMKIVLDPVTGSFVFQHQRSTSSSALPPQSSPSSDLSQNTQNSSSTPSSASSATHTTPTETSRHSQRMDEHSRSHYIVEMFRQICDHIATDNAQGVNMLITGNNQDDNIIRSSHAAATASQNIPTPFSLDSKILSTIKMELLSMLVHNNIITPTASQPIHCIQDGSIQSSLQNNINNAAIFDNVQNVTNISPLPPNISQYLINAIKDATPRDIGQTIQQICRFSHAKVTAVGPIEDIPSVIEADAKTSNGTWSLMVL